MTLPFNPYYDRRQPIGPGLNGFAITPNDNIPLTAITSRIYVGVGGSLALVLSGDPKNGVSPATGAATQPIVLQNVPSGAIFELAVAYVMATGTTASGIIGLV
jgi:hypothetical protein